LKKISKNTVLLGGAVVLGILCFVGAQSYFKKYLADAEQRLAKSYEKTKVVVASENIAAGGTISAANLAVRSIPKRYVSSTALTPADLEQFEGTRLVVPAKPGDPIDRGALDRSERLALSTTVEEGERAITFPVDEISSISGMLVPGDIIDLMFTGAGTTANSYQTNDVKELTHVRVMLEAVPVMATGKMTKKRTVRAADGSERQVDVDFNTVTLKVTPQQAEQVLLGQKLGQLTAVLRNPRDQGTWPRGDILDEVKFKRVVGAPAGGHVEMIIGGTGKAGGEKINAEVGHSLLAMLGQGAARTPATPTANAPGQDAGDVRSRLGIAPQPVNPPSSRIQDRQ
jgi:pilus assembly protein CpaB